MIPENFAERRLTDSAQRVIRHIADRALDRGMVAGELTEGTAGMLAVLSILRWERKVALAVLEQLGADLDRLAREIDEGIRAEGLVARNPDGPQFRLSSTGERQLEVDTGTPLHPLVEQAERESQEIGHDWVGTEHLLLAAVRSACPRFREVLDCHRVTHERVRESVLDLLGPPPEAGSLPESSTD
ncbi:MAG: Clp protease N-terminal domain-containing protein [Pirellulales bacterium]